jgi:hypothetical protein
MHSISAVALCFAGEMDCELPFPDGRSGIRRDCDGNRKVFAESHDLALTQAIAAGWEQGLSSIVNVSCDLAAFPSVTFLVGVDC